jgi:hypothetical protein
MTAPFDRVIQAVLICFSGRGPAVIVRQLSGSTMKCGRRTWRLDGYTVAIFDDVNHQDTVLLLTKQTVENSYL